MSAAALRRRSSKPKQSPSYFDGYFDGWKSGAAERSALLHGLSSSSIMLAAGSDQEAGERRPSVLTNALLRRRIRSMLALPLESEEPPPLPVLPPPVWLLPSFRPPEVEKRAGAPRAKSGLAECLFDNFSEWPDELGFVRGELLRVLDRNPGGGLADGWWLCCNKLGQRGIVPANRLRLIHSFRPSSTSSPSRGGDVPADLASSFTPAAATKVVTPRRFGEIFSYGAGSSNGFGGSFFEKGELDEFFDDAHSQPSAPEALATPRARLLHGAESPFRMFNGERSAPGPTSIYDVMPPREERTNGAAVSRVVPIKLETPPPRAPEQPTRFAESIQRLRIKSPPPAPPTRRTFLTTTSSDDSLSFARNGGTTYDVLRRPQEEAQVRVPVGGSSSDRSSSLSEASTLATSPSVPVSTLLYDVPLKEERKAPPPPPRAVAMHDEKQLTSVLLNVLEDLYDTPSPKKTVLEVLNRSTDSGNATDTSDTAKVAERTPAPYAYTAETLPKGEHELPQTASRNGFANGIKEKRTVTFATPSQSTATATYDILPKSAAKSALRQPVLKEPERRLSVSSVDSKDSDYQCLLVEREEQMSQCSALEMVAGKTQNVKMAVVRLCSFVGRNWRTKEYLQAHLGEIRAACAAVETMLGEFIQFSVRAAPRAERPGAQLSATGEKLMKRLAHLLRPLRSSLKLLRAAEEALAKTGWNIVELTRGAGDLADGAPPPGNDELDRFIAISRELPEDCRQLASFLHGNASLLFASHSDEIQARPLPPVPPPSTSVNGSVASLPGADPLTAERGAVLESEYETDAEGGGGAFDDYDFLDGHRESASSEASDDKAADEPQPTSKPPVVAGASAAALLKLRSAMNGSRTGGDGEDGDQAATALQADDKEILDFYLPQIEQHMGTLTNAIDAFLQTIEQNAPPQQFISHSKFVVLAAHKLVYIGDSIAQCIRHTQLSARVRACSDRLCELLKYAVAATKQASLQYPAIPSIQAMVDASVHVSQGAYDLKLLVQHARAL